MSGTFVTLETLKMKPQVKGLRGVHPEDTRYSAWERSHWGL